MLEILFNVFKQRKARYRDSCTGPKATAVIVQGNGCISHCAGVCVCVFECYMGHGAKLKN